MGSGGRFGGPWGWACLALSPILAACTPDSSSPPSYVRDIPPDNSGGTDVVPPISDSLPEAGAAETSTSHANGAVSLDLPFVPSNLPGAVSTLKTPDVDDDFSCFDYFIAIDTSNGTWRCDNATESSSGWKPLHQFKVVTQSDATAPEIGVMVEHEFLIIKQQVFNVYGNRPLMILAKGSITIDGMLVSRARGRGAGAGGGLGVDFLNVAPGTGPGAGGAGQKYPAIAGGGASFCSAGGTGAPYPSAGTVAAKAGNVYGNASLIPLWGGSSGGGAENVQSGGGGGALQLVAGGRVSLAITGEIDVGGGGAYQPRSGSAGAGAGSGGSILIEAPVVTIGGSLTANGGTASCTNGGQDATTSDKVAKGDTCAGAGAAGIVSATSGAVGPISNMGTSTDYYLGGGGAGAGWIRVNSTAGAGAFAQTAIVSPAVQTHCASEGTLSMVAADGGTIADPPVQCDNVTASSPSCTKCLQTNCCAELYTCNITSDCRTCLAFNDPAHCELAGPEHDALVACSAKSCSGC